MDVHRWVQVLGRNLEAQITAAEALQKMWKDDFVSIEHLVLAAVDDPSFGSGLMRQFGVTKDKLERAIKDVRGSKRVSGAPCCHPSGHCLGPGFCSALHLHMITMAAILAQRNFR